VRVETELRSVDDRLSGMKGQREEKKASIPRQEAELKKLRSDCARRMAAEGFKDEMECSAALLPLEEIERLKIEVERFSHSLSAAAERSGRAADACRGLTKPDMNAVTAARDEADRRMGELRKEDGILEGEQRGLDEALRTIGEREARVTLLDREYAVAGRLAEITGGQNKKRMTLQRFVLAALFEEVAMAASQRLTRMSRGRYHLVRSEAPRDNKATSGLDLDVTDDYIGEKRPAFTLSGGESFLASLSLALGLSDVVMAQCGGRYLDCIFIDEGFGSLDGETLDFALNTLIELHRTGRVIGIISHVSELKERIPSRIEVVSSKDGSRIMQQDA
jgi:exonuclease SbcC